ncbi:MAG: alpha/beta hydrolase [Oscillibacter sp.]|uniref:alpha/beta fold hydrolase n=1 Tax=Oscillibacter sp. TaxID=1945593 RepID=UPI00132638CC|nr:alpha/beta hydrolase [Oscillibacter sp.]MUU13168.1 alpha/beta hydrolase [Oscillibacter sp.]
MLIDWGARFFVKTLQNLTMDRCAKDVHELIEYLGLEDVTLLGWSMGSSVVMEYYEQFGDEHLKKIGVIDSALYPFSPESWNSHSLAGFNMDAMTATLENALSTTMITPGRLPGSASIHRLVRRTRTGPVRK